MPSIDKLRHNIRHAVSLSAFSPNLIHRIRYFFSLYSYFPRLLFIICDMVYNVNQNKNRMTRLGQMMVELGRDEGIQIGEESVNRSHHLKSHSAR